MLRLPVIQPQACIGCGDCCRQATCGLGQLAHGPHTGVCPSLREEGGRSWCGLVLDAHGTERQRLERALSIGEGCCSGLSTVREAAALGMRRWAVGDPCRVWVFALLRWYPAEVAAVEDGRPTVVRLPELGCLAQLGTAQVVFSEAL